MTAPVDTERLRETLSGLLQETDPHRPLDSLEIVVVLTYLGEHGVPRSDIAADDRPKTIEGWVTWVAKHSAAS